MTPPVRRMPARPLGRTGLDVTTLGFGASGIGNLNYARPDGDAARAVSAAWHAGIRLFDTAPHYGLGLSERRLGSALRPYPRDEYVLSTKVGRLLRPNPAPTGSDLAAGGFDVPDDLARVWDFSADGVKRSLHDSLTRLGVDRIDIVYVHDPDHAVDDAIGHAIPALIALRDQGVIGAVGVGMNQWQAPLRMVRETDLDVVMLAGRYTLLDRAGEQLLDECAGRGVAVVAAAPFNSGILARPWPPSSAHYDYGPASDPVLQRARRLAETCRAHGVQLPAAALQFPLLHPAVASVVTGMGSAEHVEAAVSGSRSYVPAALWRAMRPVSTP
ncbi:D-threo-aldose 1-dehydrogenase [Allocatelliglobosispora scoriae]|uniref:D-threo-aldose 1-dehydrogenase n=1 Tax=Allocatelliglobosispora scoriae TaxID=643052 RepID=A0A841BHX4_9ACTN|nr:aldo/keto reductase [Allocatelliglobosispora scoriae]MBB5866776.1 D-threo-aldose 1-dehydrogenase [Allocatelliglobosispora scoriae]